MADSETIRAKRAAILEEKKRKLEELKSRRSNRSSSSLGDISDGASGTLDDYIDGLLNNRPPTVVLAKDSSTVPTIAPSVNDSTLREQQLNHQQIESLASTRKHEEPPSLEQDHAVKNNQREPTREENSALVYTESPKNEQPSIKVEVFAVGTQTDEDELSPVHSKGDDNEKVEIRTEAEKELQAQNKSSNKNHETQTTLLDPAQIEDTLASIPFSTFFTSASKKVERLLGAPILSSLLVDDNTRYVDDDFNQNSALDSMDINEETKNDEAHSNKKNVGRQYHPLVNAQVSFSLPSWTSMRDITSIDWSSHHRSGEVLLASYNTSHFDAALGSTSSVNSMQFSSVIGSQNVPIVSHLPLHDPAGSLSSLLVPRSSKEKANADGLALIWNLTMPSRPEHIFTCGSPVILSKFHPSDCNVIIGATESGQIVLWDIRNGSRLPVQKSSLSVAPAGGNNAAGMLRGHSHPIVGMDFIDGGSALVTGSSDGRINYWSLSNLRDPAETFAVHGNISSLAVSPETYSIVAGDENGSFYIISSSTSNSSNLNPTDIDSNSVGRNLSSASNARRSVRILKSSGDEGSQDRCGHFGMVTGVSTKKSSTSSGSLSRGVVRGPHGLVLTCGVDWTTKLWAPAYSDQPILNWISHSYDYMSDVQWSPVHPAAFATSCCDGTIHMWNLCSSLDEPLSGTEGINLERTDVVSGGNVSGSSGPTSFVSSNRGLNRLKWSLDGRRIAAAYGDVLYVVGLSDEFWKLRGDEEKIMMSHLKNRGLIDEDI